MKQQLSNLKIKLNHFLVLAKKYRAFIFLILVLASYAFLILRINLLTQSEPSAVSVSDKQKVIPRLKIDQTAVNKILQLEDQNVEVKALFEKARNNPFAE